MDSALTFDTRMQLEAERFPTSRRIPFGIAEDLAILDTVNDDAINSKFCAAPQDLASGVEAKQF